MRIIAHSKSCALASALAAMIITPAYARSPAPSATAQPAEAASQSLPTSDAAHDWQKFADELGKAGMRIHAMTDANRSPEQQAEVNQALMWALSSASLSFARLDPDYPDWVPILNSAMLGINGNQDNVYQITRIRGDGTYRIEGDRGRLKHLFIELTNGLPGFTDKSTHIGIYDLNEMKADAAGHFELVMSPQRPAGYSGNWIALDSTAADTFISVRHVSYDWRHDRDANLSIQRIDRPINLPRRTAPDTSKRLAGIPRYVENMLSEFVRIQDRQGFMRGEVNVLKDGTPGFGKNMSSTNITQQAYYMGAVHLSRDQALVLVGVIPTSCDYWSVMLMDTVANPLDYMFRQSGLNGYVARVDPDGKVRIVVSERDPGVENWVDKSSYELNGIRGRFYKCGTPSWTSKVVPMSALSSALYPGTPQVTADQRQQALRERIELVQHRRRW